MIPILFILNLADYIITLHNRGNFVEANKLMQQFINDPVILGMIKIIIVPMLIWVLYKNRDLKLVKIGTGVLTVVYGYAVVLGIMIALL